jgi:Protein of unknown function (DUF2961)
MFAYHYRGAGSFTSQSIASLPYLRRCVAGRKSSYDRSGANSDWAYIPARTETKIAEIEGPGVISHIWIPFAPDPFKRTVIRMYWDGERDPSVEAPLSDFFGSSLGELMNYSSAMTSCAPVGGFNCYFPMPFAKSAVITIFHDHDEPIKRLYFNVDYLALPNFLTGVGNFHAQYRQSGAPKLPVALHAGGLLEHQMMQAQGRGHVVGCTYSLIATISGEWEWLRESLRFNLDGDKNTFLDDGVRPSDSAEHLNVHSYSWCGRPYAMVGGNFMGRFSRYRWFLDGPPSFQQEMELNLAVSCELVSNWIAHSVGYWYQVEPHQKFPSLPAAEDRVPRLDSDRA